MPRILIHFSRFGPYHQARLRSAAEALHPLGWEVIGLETAGTDATYAWDERSGISPGPKVVTAFPGREYEAIRSAETKRVLFPLLGEWKPDAMVIAGWSGPDARACLSWCRRNGIPASVMSETREADGRRVWWKERIKRWIISHFHGALVGGKSHRDYLLKLGMPPDVIAFGYNVVDNAYFAAEAANWRDQRSAASGQDAGEQDIDPNNQEQGTKNQEGGTSPYFLASNRFIERKNLSRLIQAYATYTQTPVLRPSSLDIRLSISPQPSPPWNLCLLGDGELKPALIAQCHALGMNVIECAPWETHQEQGTKNQEQGTKNQELGTVFFPGFRQIEELPRFYAHAGCFVHPALEEPWGLVINEAMACGLPVLSSRNVGAAEELVDDGVNGWRFDAEDVEGISQIMLKISAFDFPLAAFSTASRRILEERAPLSAFGEGLASLLDGEHTRPPRVAECAPALRPVNLPVVHG